jgi:hypothetical protein
LSKDLEILVLLCLPCFQAILAQSKKGMMEGKGLSEEEFWSEVEKSNIF